MKFPQPAPNSLFALLLRAPWWVSFLVAGAIALVALALLPREWGPYGAMGALPIVVVGCIAAVRQWSAPSPAQTQATLERLAGLPWRDFAAGLEAAWRQQGFTVQRLEGAADFRLVRQGSTTLVSARRWKAATHGVEPLRALQAAMAAEDASTGLYIALQEVGDNARIFARQNGITVLNGPALATLLR